MDAARPRTEVRLLNGSTGDPALFIDYPGRNDALLFDAGDNCRLGLDRLGDLEGVFITHHHVDHFIGLDRIVRANLDRDKVLQVYGPEGSILKIYNRIRSYEYQFFPFQKIVIEVHEVLHDVLRTARLECTRKFPRPIVRDVGLYGPTIYETEDVRIEAAQADHTVPCLAFALVEKARYAPDGDKLAAGPLAPGPWVDEAWKRLRAGDPEDSAVFIGGAAHSLRSLRDAYFASSPAARIAYVTDTAWSDASRPGLMALARRAERLYCDSFYAAAEQALAEKHHHMTAAQAGEFASEAGVDELVLMHFSGRYEGRYDELVAEARERFPRVSADLSP